MNGALQAGQAVLDGGGVRRLQDVEADAREGHGQRLRRAAGGRAVGFARKIQLEVAEREIGGAGHARDGGKAARKIVGAVLLQGGGKKIVVDHDIADGGDGDGDIRFCGDLAGCGFGRGGHLDGLVRAAGAEDQHGREHRNDEQDEEHKADLHTLALALLQPPQAARLGELLLLIKFGLGHAAPPWENVNYLLRNAEKCNRRAKKKSGFSGKIGNRPAILHYYTSKVRITQGNLKKAARLANGEKCARITITLVWVVLRVGAAPERKQKNARGTAEKEKTAAAHHAFGVCVGGGGAGLGRCDSGAEADKLR